MVRLCACALSALLSASGAPASDEAPLAWSPPVDARIVHTFRPGLGAFEVSGHAGVDYAVPAATPVRAAGDGVVAFVGNVAGATFVVIAHGGGLRTAYGQLATTAVRRLEPVGRGDVVGTAGGAGMRGHESGLLHFGLRVDGRPVDPLALFAPPDLTEVVRLVPADDAVLEVGGAGVERALAASWFGSPEPIPPWMRVPGDPPGLAGQIAGGIGTGTRWVVRRAGRMVVVAPFLVRATGEGRGLLFEVGRGVGDWWSLRADCSPTAPPADGFTGTDHDLFVVAGVNSSTAPDGSTNALRPSELGYDDGDVTWFSYTDDGGPYEKDDTHIGPEAAAAHLDAQLRAFARAHPGRPVDLIGHSQGGVVVEVFLKQHYAGHESEFPPLGRVVTLAAPHRGSAAAALGADLAWVPGADEMTALLSDLPGPSAPSTTQLAEGSEFVTALMAVPLPANVEVTTIGAVGDVLVTADQTRLAGATHVDVDPPGWSDHSAILTDPAALGAARLVLSGQPPPCVSLSEAVRDRVQPRSIHAAERLLGLGPSPVP